MSSKGKISLEELNTFLESGVLAVKILGMLLKKTEEQIYDMMSSGELVTSKYQLALIKGMNEGTDGVNGATAAYGGLAIEMKNTLSGELDTPKDHCMKLIVGFGYPEIKYARGVQKDRRKKVHKYSEN
jgi:hypothetical protein